MSDETHRQLRKEKCGDETFDDIINRWRIAKELLPESTQEALSSLDTPAERGIFLTGLIFNQLGMRDNDWQKKMIIQKINILSNENFGKVYTDVVNKVYSTNTQEKYETLLEMASMELLKGGIDKMPSDDIRFVFTLGETLPPKK